jgi:mannose-6-phosphate isomerase
LTSGRRVEKPWGYEEIWAETEHYVAKILFIRKGHRLSLQHHEEKTETIRVARGTMHLQYDDSDGKLTSCTLEAGQCHHLPPGCRHRMRAVTNVEIFEVSTPHLNDVVRHDDDYGRS